MVSLILGAVVGACANRIRGGLLGDLWGVRGQLSRLIFATLLTAAMLFAGWPWPVDGWRLAVLALTFVAAWFLGAIWLGTLGAIDSGRRENSIARDFAMNALRGCGYVVFAAAALASFRAVYGDEHGAWAAGFMLLGGAMQGICYELSHRLRPMPEHPATEYGEASAGFFIGLGASAAALA